MLKRQSPGSPRIRTQSGFGLTEALLTVTLFGGSMLAIAGTAARVGSGLNATHQQTRAMAVANAQIERLLASPYDDLRNGAAYSNGVTLTWNVVERDGSKEIVLTYLYHTPERAQRNELVAARVAL